MLINLPNGKTVDMSFEDYMRAGPGDYQYLMSQSYGYEIEDPFFGSALRDKAKKAEEPEDEDDDEVDEEVDLGTEDEN